jgi:hypothetical protein
MKSLAILMLLALELAVSGCGTSSPSTVTNTSASGSWEAQLTGGTAEASKLNFVTAFNVTNNGPLDITGFNFFNAGACFANGTDVSTETGSASFTTNTGTDQVTGTLTLTVTSTTAPGNVLTLTSYQNGLTGTSNGTTTTTGTLSNGVAVGKWSLTADPSCTGPVSPVTGTFIMCQGAATCTVP